MNCPTCSHKMTLLFTSVVCDRCNPPESVMSSKTSSKRVYRGYVLARRPIALSVDAKPNCFVFETRASALDYARDIGVHGFDTYEVVSDEPLNYGSGSGYVLVSHLYKHDRYNGTQVIRPA